MYEYTRVIIVLLNLNYVESNFFLINFTKMTVITSWIYLSKSHVCLVSINKISLYCLCYIPRII